MSDITATIRTIALADADVLADVGSRMYSDALPQKRTDRGLEINTQFPAITYKRIDTLPEEHLGGIVDFSRARIQIDCYAKTRGAATSLADTIRLALEKNNRGDNSGQFIYEINLAQAGRDEVIRPEVGTDERLYVDSQDFFVSYQTTTS